MKKHVLFILLLTITCAALYGQAFIIPTNNNNARQLSCSCYQLTADSGSQHGAIWNQNAINLNTPFDFKFDVYFGNRNGAGADGMVFVIQNQNTSLSPSPGGGMGYQNLTGKSIGIEFDTFDNTGTGTCDISQPHIAMDTGGVMCPGLTGPVSMLPSGAAVDDGAWHTTEIVWDPTTQTLSVYFDGYLRQATNFAGGFVNTIFNGQNNVYWGWTGGTGGLTNVQQVCASFKSEFSVGTNYIHCGPDTVTFQSTATSNLNNIIGYNWLFGDGSSSTQQNPTHTFAAPGAYNVKLIVTDQTLCQDTQLHQVRIDVPIAFKSQNNVTCNGGNNGKATVNALAGVVPYSYSWNPAVSTSSIANNLTAGNYTVIVSDSAGCTVSAAYAISEPAAVTATETHTDVLCNGTATGSVTFAAAGGNPGYTYTWTPNVSSTNTATNVPAGTYTVIIKDINNCTGTQTSTVAEPPRLVITAVPADALCYGQSSGTINASATGGIPGYNFSASNGSTPLSSATGQFSNLAASTYVVIVTDQNACADTAAAVINQPTLITNTNAVVNVLCHGFSTGSITITTTGGTPGAGYAYAWPANASNTNTANNLPAGSYSITVTDANSCTVLDTTSISEPPGMIITATPTAVHCYGENTGAISVTVTGGAPAYMYQASDGVNPQNSNTGQFANLYANSYTVKVTDQNACFDTVNAVVTQPTQVTDSISFVNPVCYHYSNGSLSVTALGGNTSFNYAFSNGVNNTTGKLTGLVAGSYVVSITDNKGCTTQDSAILTQPDSVLITVSPSPVEVKLGESLQISTTTNQSGILTYAWGPNFGLSCYDCANPLFEGNYSRDYKVLVTNTDGCIGTADVDVTVVPVYDVFFPNAFTPNGDGANDLWKLFGNLGAIKQIEISVFDRIGEKVFESNDVNFEWDGKYKGEYVTTGVYTYTAKIVWLNNHADGAIKGALTLLR